MAPRTSREVNTESQHRPAPVRFHIPDATMRRYTELVGDASSLHTSAEFARTTVYGAIIAYGVMPVFYLSLLKWRDSFPVRLRFRRLSANFNQPVFIGEPLELAVTHLSTADGEVEIEYEVLNRDTRAVVTTGAALLAPADAMPDALANVPASPHARLQAQALVEQCREFADINKGDAAGFDVVLSGEAMRSLHEMILLGAESPRLEWREWLENCDAGSLLLAPLFTTVIGMFLPGKRGTCANFEAAFPQAPPLGARARMDATVAFKSASTSTILVNMALTDTTTGASFASGKVHARVQPPPGVA